MQLRLRNEFQMGFAYSFSLTNLFKYMQSCALAYAYSPARQPLIRHTRKDIYEQFTTTKRREKKGEKLKAKEKKIFGALIIGKLYITLIEMGIRIKILAHERLLVIQSIYEKPARYQKALAIFLLI